MTVATTTTTVTAQGNGATTVFTFPFIGVSGDDLVVSYTDATGIVTELAPSQYSLVINTVPVGGLWGIGGSVTYPITGAPPVPIATGTYLSITRAVPYVQEVSIANQGAFYPQVVERGLDRLELQIQQLETSLLYTIRVPVTDPVPPDVLPNFIQRANGYLAFDNDGQPYITTIPSVTPSPGTYATPRRIVTTGTGNINIDAGDSFAGVSVYQSTSPATTLQLPEGYGPFPVFDGSLNAGTYPIRILPPAGKTILGQAQYYLAFNGQSAVFYNDGLNILVG